MRRILILPLIALALMAFKPFEQISPGPASYTGSRPDYRAHNSLMIRKQGKGSLLPSQQNSSGIDRLLVTDRQAATATPKPTGTPIPTPPPANPAENNMMIFFVAIAVLVIIIGVWINRQRTWGA